MAILTFRKPFSSYTENYNTVISPLLCAGFGPFYWMARRNWLHAVISLIPAILTYGLSNIVYAFFANRINLKWYDYHGWEPMTNYDEVKKASHVKEPFRLKFNWKTVLFVIIAAVIVVVIKQQIVPVSGGGSTLYNMTKEAE